MANARRSRVRTGLLAAVLLVLVFDTVAWAVRWLTTGSSAAVVACAVCGCFSLAAGAVAVSTLVALDRREKPRSPRDG